jgi:hypothetical protein
MRIFFSIIIATLAIMGLFALLDWWADKARLTANLSRGRRSFLGLIVSFIGGLLIGSYTWYEDKRARQTLHLLFEFEVLLAQLEGLVSAALAQGDVTKLLPSIETLVDKIDEYGSKAARLLPELRERLSGHDSADLELGASMIISGLGNAKRATIGERKTDGDNSPLITIQKGVSLARAKTRELIDARISKS